MAYDPKKHHRRSIRLNGYDYAQPGAYFVTTVTHQRECLFGDVVDGEMMLNVCGEIAKLVWDELPNHYPYVILDEFCVMPNHVHMIIVLSETSSSRGGFQTHPYPKRHALPEIVRGFKTFSARRINESQNSRGVPVWQRNYYERIVRDDREMNAIRQYIQNNPLNWEQDKENPHSV